MTLLLRDPDVKPDEPVPPAAVESRLCPTCQAPLEADQDWCLSCGSAQPGRLAGLPGKRAAATVLALTTLLVGGAVAASYAALQKDPANPASTTPTQLAQVPAPAATASTVAPADTAPSTATPPTPAGSDTIPDTSPKSTPPATPPASSSPSIPSTPSSSGSTAAGTTSSGSTTGSGTTTSGSTTGSGSGTATPRTSTTTTPADTAPKAIKLDPTAAALYDPYSRDTADGDASKALDGNPSTSFPLTVADGSQEIGAGLVVDLGKLRGLKELDLTTKTPGFRVEIYATDSEELPPNVLDTRWAHIKDVSNVGKDGAKQIVTLGSGTTKYRSLLLWFTTPPTDGTTLRVSELKLFG